MLGKSVSSIPCAHASLARASRMVVHLEDDDVLQLVALLFPDVNFASGKLIDHLIATEQARSGSGSRDRRCCCAIFPAPRARHRRSARDKSTVQTIAEHSQRQRQTRVTLTPLARSAINSLSAESRPKTSRIAVSNPQGMVKMSENGRT